MLKKLGFGAALGGLLFAGVAYASAPTVTLDPIGPLEYALFPQVYNVTGEIAHTPNIESISELKLFINDVQEGVTVNPSGLGTTASFSLPWNILAPGTYAVKVTAKHGGTTGEDAEEVIVTQLPPIVITECPAAPAIGAAYMKSLGIKGTSKTFSAVIKLVAGETGSKGSLWAARSCESGYAAEVKSYVDSKLP